MNRQKINIVDDDNNLIGTKYRDEIDYAKDRYQCSGLWISNSKGEILLAQRSLAKDKDPGKWGPAVAGTIDEGETFESNIYKEAEEEIGLTGIQFRLGPLARMDSPRKHFAQWFYAKIDKPANEFTLQEEEVEKLEWINKEKFLTDIENNPEKYVPSLVARAKELVEGDC